MPIEEAVDFFGAVPRITRYLQTLVDVGLGYVRLGQPAPDPLRRRGAARQARRRAAAPLHRAHRLRARRAHHRACTSRTSASCSGCSRAWSDKGNTVIVIEHNLDVIKSADWVIDMGPEGGSGGGTVVATGTPEQVAEVPESYTGQFLADVLAAHRTPVPVG